MVLISSINTILYLINGTLGLIGQLIIYTLCIYMSNKNKENILYALIKLIIVSIPTSFINIFGGSYGDLPLSGFNIVLIISNICLLLLHIKNIYKNLGINLFASIVFIFIGYYFISMLRSQNIISGMSSFFTVCIPMIFILLILLIENIQIDCNKLKQIYINIVVGSAMGLIFQIVIHKLLGIELGYILYMEGRVAYAGLFKDFSFYSVYLSSASACVLIDYIINKNNIKDKCNYIVKLVFLTLASMLTSARAGTMSMIVALAIVIFISLIKGDRKDKIKALFIYVPILFVAMIILIYILAQLRQESQSILGDSGRGDTYLAAFNVFKKNIILGIGPGIDNYVNYATENLNGLSSTIPHNFIMQFLAQLGIIGTTLAIFIIRYILNISYKLESKELSVMFLVTFISNFVLPDMFNTRFICIQMLLIILSYESMQGGKENEDITCNK